MSYIDIIINTVGDVVRKQVSFKPSMIDMNIKSTNVYFPPTFVLTNKKILKVVKETSSVPEILTSATMFDTLVKYYTDRAKGYKRINLEQANSLGIIDKNFEFMLKLWFKPNSQIIIDNRAYNIIKSDITNTKLPNNRSNLRFEMRVNLKLIRKDRDSRINRQKMSCEQQRDDINTIYETLYGVPFFSYREKSTKPQNAPVMYTNDKGQTTGKTQTKSPYVPPQYNITNTPFYMVPANTNLPPPAYPPPAYPPPAYPPQYTRRGGYKRRKSVRRTRGRRS